MIELIQFPWSPFCLVQRRILEYSGVPFKITNIPDSDRSLVWRLTRQRYYGVPIIRDGRTVVFETDEFSQIIAKYLDGKFATRFVSPILAGVDRMVWRNIEDQVEGAASASTTFIGRNSCPRRSSWITCATRSASSGRGCLEQWRAEQVQWLDKLDPEPHALRIDARRAPFLLRDRAAFYRFRPLGMLANFLYSGHYQLPAAHARLHEWHERMSKATKADRPVKNYILDTNVLLHDPNSLLASRTTPS